jgi:hypothetical protein
MTNNTDPLRAHKPCGGCGNADPEKVCVGCLHDFGGTLASAPPSVTVGVEGLLERMEVQATNLRRAAATNREAGESIHAILDAGHQYEPDDPVGLAEGLISDADDGEALAALLDEARAALSQQPAAPSGEAVAEVVHADGAPGGVLIKRMSGVGRNIPHGTKLYAAPRQPAAVDGVVGVLLEKSAALEKVLPVSRDYAHAYEVHQFRAALTAALAAQQQGSRHG